MTDTPKVDRQWVADELAIIEIMASELEAYIVDGAVYRTIISSTTNGKRKMMMSGGDLLARLNRLHEYDAALSVEQQNRLEIAEGLIQRITNSLRTRFYDVLRRELKARHDQLNWNVEVRRAQSNDEADVAELHNRQHIIAIQEELKEA